jgi:hypothetical protein
VNRKLLYVGNFSQPHCTEVHLARTFEDDLGWSVVRMQENQTTTDQIFDRCMTERPDLFLFTRTWGLRGNGNRLMRDLLEAGIPTASYHLDLYWGISREAGILGDPFWQTKYVFTADGGSDDRFVHAGIHHKWIRPGVFRQECYLAEPDPARFACDVAFVGCLDGYHPEWQPYRTALKSHLREWYGDRFRHWPLPGHDAIRNHDLNRLYATAKVCVGDSLCPGFKHPRYWSDRLTETIGRGGFLIHPRIEGIEDELQDGKHLALFGFNDWDGLKARIDHYLANEAERLAIRDAGHEHVKAHCTYTNRLREMLAYVGEREGWVDLGVAA